MKRIAFVLAILALAATVEAEELSSEPVGCITVGDTVLTNAVFHTSYQTYAFAGHHDTWHVAVTSEPEPHYIVFFNSAPICLTPRVPFTVIRDSGAALFVYFGRPENVKGLFNRGVTWFVWWIGAVPPE